MELGSLVSWVAVIPGSISAAIAFYQARKSRKAAYDAREALSTAIRPIFAFGWNKGALDQPEFISITASNTGQFDAVDIEVWAGTEGSSPRAKGTALRIPGRVPGTLGGNAGLTISEAIPVADIDVEGVIAVTARFSDEQGIQRWEQRGLITVGTQGDGSITKLVSRKFDQGKPVKYTRS
jgi:hypothetical protein